MAANNTQRPCIDISSLPDISKEEMDFHDSSFFQSSSGPIPQLPTPSSILQQWPKLGQGVVKFEDLNLAVKVGGSDYLRLEEAQTMRAIREAFPHDEIPVPEVFGWRKHGNKTFIYMSLLRGPTLREAWKYLTNAEKESLCGELKRIVTALRRLNPHSSTRFIASINGGTVQDRFFKLDYEEGPFHTIKSFNDWMFIAATRQPPESAVVDGPYRDYIPDSGNIFFAHGDLTLGNIIVSGASGSTRIVGIIDWEQAGWYPEYWEYFKLTYGVEYSHEWRAAGWADKVIEPCDEDLALAVSEYFLWRNP